MARGVKDNHFPTGGVLWHIDPLGVRRALLFFAAPLDLEPVYLYWCLAVRSQSLVDEAFGCPWTYSLIFGWAICIQPGRIDSFRTHGVYGAGFVFFLYCTCASGNGFMLGFG